MKALAERDALVRRLYAAWSDGDLDAFLALVEPDFQLRTSGYFPDFAPEYHGHDGMARFWAQMREPWTWFRIELGHIVERGDGVVTESRWRALGRESGVETELRFGHVFTFRGDRLLRLAAYRSFDEALDAVDPREPKKT